MPAERKPRVVGVIAGAPMDRLTWSGSSYHFFSALSRRGMLEGTVDATPPRLAEYVAIATSFRPQKARWRERLDQSLVERRAASLTGVIRARRVSRQPDALLQVGAWYEFSRIPGLRPRVRCSYHDANLAVYMRRDDIGDRFDPKARYVRRAFDYERRVYDGMSAIYVMSEGLRRSFIEDFGQDPDKVVTVGAGPNLSALPDPPERDFSRPRFLFVGKNYVLKGGPQVLEAFEHVRREHPEAELWMVGPPEPVVERPGVRWFGTIVRDTAEGDALLERLYREATTYVMPSNYDAFGIVFLEAMAHRLPCVGAARWAMPEIIEDGVTGHVVPHGDVDGLAEVLSALARDPARAEAMGAAGFDRLRERFTWDGVAARIDADIQARLAAA
jgi:glycosyltransferase involved in cell wall biosynthesis